jgi:MAF protein
LPLKDTTTMTPRLILASSSPRRQALIASLGLAFEVVSPDVDETRRPAETPLDYVRRLAEDKARSVATQLSSTSAAAVLAADTMVVLGADTVGLELNGDILIKPTNPDEARHTLQRLRGREHIVCTAFSLLQTDVAGQNARHITDAVITRVLMRAYGDDEIESYIANGSPYDKAGGYAIQDAGFVPVQRIDGCYHNVVGLPLCAVKRALNRIGWPGIAAPQDCDCPPYQPVA